VSLDQKQYAFAEVVPHTQPMVLLDDIEARGDDYVTASVVLSPESPFAEDSGVPAWVGIEYMAQTIAAFSGVGAREQGLPIKMGFLVGSRSYKSSVSEFPFGTRLFVHAEQIIQGDNGLFVFSCSISCRDKMDENNSEKILAEANLNVFQPDDPEAFLSGGG
jgi:predicted hotdog family 3-hydroxylacyl-ACP dehydratase